MAAEAHASGGRAVRDLVREVITELAPEELPLLEGVLELDDAAAVRRLSGHGQRREPLGFGVGEIAVLVTPVVWLALDQAARRIGDIALERASRASAGALRRLFRRSPPPVVVPPLTREQLAEVKRLVLETAEQRGLAAPQASEIANTVVAGLVLAEPPPPDEGEPGPPAVAGPTPEG
ncbi:hypothetical protein [Streptomyces albus]|uniref:hypothetical protein n=1 Tax=Streptomyces albus TaxID=1888 RepID=UPI000B02B1FD|nr:hypothetical protein [Streptomyces albus]